jgi:hypothetical protein
VLSFSVAFLLLATSPLTSAACHVVKQGGAGNQSGSNWNNALSDFPASLRRGDVYYVAAGTYRGHTFNDPDSGRQTIEIRSVTPSDHCTDVGWNGSYVGSARFINLSKNDSVFRFENDYYIINGQYRNPDWHSGYGIIIDNRGKVACNADIELGDTRPVVVHDIMIEYVEINGSHPTGDTCNEQGVRSVAGSYNEMFQYDYVHDVGGCNFFLRGNHRHSIPGWGSGDNITIQFSYISMNYSSPAVHGEGCSCSEGLTNLTIRYNRWVDIEGTAVIATPSGGGYDSGNGDNGPWYIYGNLMYATSTSHCKVVGMFFAWDTTFVGPIYILNNTFANWVAGCNGVRNGITIGDGAHRTPMGAVYVQNNLWWNSDNIIPLNRCPIDNGQPTCTSMTWDHNAYFRSDRSRGGSADRDPHKQLSTADPFVHSTEFNFQLAKDTKRGADTRYAVPGNNVDLDGTIRGADNVWDRGAFQILGTASKTSRP